MRLFKVLIITSLVVLSSNCFAKASRIKYVFYFIGDGMSFAQIESANMYLKAQKNDTNGLILCDIPVRSVLTTSAFMHPITCSSAAGTALATGYKTIIGTLGLSPDGKIPHESVAEYAKSEGRKVGIISSVFINHATPAAFYAKIVGRDDYYNIGKQLVSSSFDYFAGGIIKDAYKPDNKSIYELAEINRYKVIETMAQFNALQPADGKVIVGSLALNGGENIKPSIDRTPSELSLADYLSKGIEMLDNPDGFLIMCEGGQIDWACHANDLAQSIGEVIDFDNAINVALRFYNQHPDQTLIVITSDHETGGLSLGSNKMKYEMNPMVLHNQKLSNESFNSRVIKPLKKSGSVGLKQVSDSIRKYYSLGGEIALDEWDNQRIEKAYNASFNHVGEKSVQDSLLYDKYEPVGLVSSRILAEKAGFSWTTFVHTAMPVPVRSVGVGSELFNNLQDNTQLAPIIRDLMSQ